MSLATRAARAISRRLIPTPSSAPRPHPPSLLSNRRRYQHVLNPDRNRFSTHAGIQVPEIPTASYIARDESGLSLMPRGDTSCNIADRIEEELLDKGYRVWGFVIYRCTYGDDAVWETCLERLNASTRKSMQYYNGLDLLEEGCYKPTAIAGARFDGAKTQHVREHFKELRKQAVLEEQGSSEDIEARRRKPEPVHHPYGTVGPDETKLARLMQEVDLSPPDYVLPHLPRPRPDNNRYGNDHYSMAVRYRFCVQIDEAAMQSIVSSANVFDDAWVNVIEADWLPKDATTQFEEAWVEHVDHGPEKDTFDHVVEIFPEIEGCIEENTGWMKVHYHGLVPGFYASMTDPNTLEEYLY